MTWFKVSDTHHSDSKTMACAADAMGLWVIAGSWSASELKDGFVPDHVLLRLVTEDAHQLARKLVAAGFWKRARGGYQFLDWSKDQPTAEQVLADREKARTRMRELREGTPITARRAGQKQSRSGEQTANFASTSPEVPDPVPSRPPSLIGKGRDGGTNAPPPDAAPRLHLVPEPESERPPIVAPLETTPEQRARNRRGAALVSSVITPSRYSTSYKHREGQEV